MKKFAIIIVNFNCSKDTIETIDSLSKFGDKLFDIYLVDNHSKPEELTLLEKNLRNQVFFIKSKKNLGFAGANNLGIKQALKNSYKYLFLLNPDTLIEDASFFSKIETEMSTSNADIIGPLVRYYPDKDRIYFAGGFVNRCTGLTIMKSKGLNISKISSSDNFECDFITGCSILIKREVFEEIGFLPEEYFLYFEETDFCLKAKNSGFRVVFTPKTYIFHKVSSSITYLSDTYLFYLVRNFRIFARKYVRNECRLISFLFYYLVWVLGYAVLSVLKNKNFTSLKTIFKAVR